MWRAQRVVTSRGLSWLLCRASAAPVYHGVEYADFKILNESFTSVLLRRSFSRILMQQISSLQSTYRGTLVLQGREFPPLLKCFQALAVDESQNTDRSGRVCSETDENNVEQSAQGVSKPLCHRIIVPKDKSVMPIVLDWVAEGNPRMSNNVSEAIIKLKRLRRFKHALEISEWLMREKPFEPKERDYSLLIYLIGKIQGPEKAEQRLSQLPTESHTEVTYTSLLEVYLEKENLNDAIRILKKIQVLDVHVQPLCYNMLIIWCGRHGLESKIPMLFKDMKKRGVPYDFHTYKNLIKFKAKIYDIKGMEDALALMREDTSVQPMASTYSCLASAYLAAGLLEKAEAATREIEKFDFRFLRHIRFANLLFLYGSLGRLDDVERVYQKIKELSLPFSRYADAIEAFGAAGSLERAVQVAQEMVSVTGFWHAHQYNAILGVYSRHGMMEKAEEILKSFCESGLKLNAITYTYLLEGYLRTGQTDKANEIAMELMKNQLNKSVRNSMTWLQSTLNIVDFFAEKGDVNSAEMFFKNLKRGNFSRLTRVYNTLLKAYVKACQPADGFLLRMALDQATPDAETHALLAQLEKSKNCVIFGR